MKKEKQRKRYNKGTRQDYTYGGRVGYAIEWLMHHEADVAAATSRPAGRVVRLQQPLLDIIAKEAY